MIATVVEVRTAADGVRDIVAVCPGGVEVVHGGGRYPEPIERYLGRRRGHCRCCESYDLARAS